MNKIYAALIFFTRLPLWKVVNPPKESYADVVMLWPYVGWLTGLTVAVVMVAAGCVMEWPLAVICAILCRLLLTGCLHEDGLADFCDAFGCGGPRERILSIMKDSHIGTYGVIGLIIYFLLLAAILITLPVKLAIWGFIAADPFAKFCASRLPDILPYARSEGAKNGITYPKMNPGKFIICCLGGIIPVGVAAWFAGVEILFAALLPIISIGILIHMMSKKIGGYTGDCCGASDLICEIVFLLGIAVIYY